MHFSIFRYNPERDGKPYMQDFHVDLRPADRMLLDATSWSTSPDSSTSITRSGPT